MKWGRYAGIMEGYEYCYEEGRNREWEEKVRQAFLRKINSLILRTAWIPCFLM